VVWCGRGAELVWWSCVWCGVVEVQCWFGGAVCGVSGSLLMIATAALHSVTVSLSVRMSVAILHTINVFVFPVFL